MLEFALAENFGAGALTDSNTAWLEALPARNYHTPMYGEVPVTVDKLQRMIQGFKQNIRGQDIAVNFDHGMDKAKGNKAAGWFKDFDLGLSSDGAPVLKAKVQFTDEAAQEIKGGAWKYFSMEWDDLWMDNAGNRHEDVIVGGAITNRPVAKHMQALPVNFSESEWNNLDEEEQKRFAEWDLQYRIALPDSSFLYVNNDAGKRYFAYKNAEGEIDVPHLRNAISRLSGDPAGIRLLAKARSILAAHSKKMSEEVLQAIEDGQLVLLDEVREWEHSEPGTGPTPQIGSPEQPDPGTGQPVPRKQGDPSIEDPAIGGGWRREAMPNPPDVVDERNTGGSALTDEELLELKKKLGIAEDADVPAILNAAETLFSEAGTAKTLREQVNAVSEERRFAEQYPTMHKQMVEQAATLRETSAHNFSESVSRVTRTEGDKQLDTDKGLSALAVDKVKEVHKKFGEGTVSLADFEEVVNTIVHGGIVDFSESGSGKDAPVIDINTDTPTGVAAARKLFAEKVNEIQTADSLDYAAAVAEAAKRHPELAAAYRATVPA